MKTERSTFVARRGTVAEIIDLRWRVLRPGHPKENAVFDGDDDPTTEHWLLCDTAVAAVIVVCTLRRAALPAAALELAKPAATARLETWQLRGMATDPAAQNRGLGGELLRVVLASFDSSHARCLLWCNARLRAVPFYERHGFVQCGTSFDVAGIGPHIVMLRS